MSKEDGGPGTSLWDEFRFEHRAIERLLEGLVRAFEDNHRLSSQRIWEDLSPRLSAHLDKEERHFIPRLLRVNSRSARAILEEHKLIRSRLSELGASLERGAVNPDAVRQFVSELRAHARHEDQVLYPDVDDRTSDSRQPPPLESGARPMAGAGVQPLIARGRGS
jgi:hemerythrin-like domain-containing protein